MMRLLLHHKKIRSLTMPFESEKSQSEFLHTYFLVKMQSLKFNSGFEIPLPGLHEI
jgi:hypothetical protein